MGRLGCRCRGFLVLVEGEGEEEKEEGVSLPEKNHIKKGKKGPRRCPIARAELLLARLRDDTALGAADVAAPQF